MQRMEAHDFDGTTFPEMSNAAMFEQYLWKTFSENGFFQDQSDFNKIRYYDAFTKAYLNTQQLNVKSTETPYELLASYVNFMVERYSYRDVVYVINNSDSYQEVFEKSFNELIQEWKSLYREKPDN